MGKDYLFVEDSRKFKKLAVFAAAIGYISFLGCLVVGILSFTKILQNYASARVKFFAAAVMFLVVALYFTWALVSKYLKYYMLITENDMEFYADGKTHKYCTADFKSYDCVKQESWLMGGHQVIKLNFAGNSHTVSSFKRSAEFKATLDKIIQINCGK